VTNLLNKEDTRTQRARLGCFRFASKEKARGFDSRPRRRLGDVESIFTQDGDCGDVGWVVLVDLPAVGMLVENDCLRYLPREVRRDGGDGLLDHLPVVLASVLVDENRNFRISGGTSPSLEVSSSH
jgi:hypothetical protein